MTNPYTLVFGQPPARLVDRNAQSDRIISDFCSENPANCINLVTGIRGSGKTVFITETAGKIQQKKDWVVVNLNPQRNLLESLAAKLASDRVLHTIFNEAQINLTAFGISIGIKGSTPISDIEDALVRMLKSMKRKNKRLLITIDEVTNSREMRIFASSFQIFLREGLPVFLLMTGLYKNIDKLKNADGMTFLERAPRTLLSPLDLYSMSDIYRDTLKINEDEAIKLAALTKGYSFAFQVIGYYSWEFPKDSEKAMSSAKEYLYEFAYRKIWSELSRVDKQVTAAIAEVPTGEIYLIREKLNFTSNQFNPYRDRLIKAGIITGDTQGIVEFALPWFDEFVKYINISLQ